MTALPTGVILEDVPCPLGCAREDVAVTRGGDRLNHVPGTFAVVRCAGCGLMRTTPRPTLGSMGAYYPDTYHAHIESPPHIQTTRTPPMLRRLLDSRAASIPQLAPGRVLEVGCASGSFLASMRDRGWEVAGIEPGASPAERASERGISVHCGPLETAPEPEQPFDLVVGWMVVEHLHDLVPSLARLRSWVKPDGWLALSVPNAASVDRRIFGNRWYALQLPAHLYHFTPETVTRVLDRGGWRVERIMHQRVLVNALGSVGHVLEDHDALPAVSQRLTGPWARRRGVRLALSPLALALSLFGQTGRMTVWARAR